MLVLNFDPFPILETESMVLRKISIEDAEEMFELRTNEDAMKYIHKARPKSIEELQELFAKMNDNSMRIQWGMALKTDNKLIGTIGYHIIEKENHRAEIGYMLHPSQWNKGLMSEAISAVASYGFDKIGLHSIEARINPTNTASAKILLKHGFNKEGYFKENYLFEGIFYDSEIYSLLKK